MRNQLGTFAVFTLAALTQPAHADDVPAFKHVMIVIFENQDVGPTGQQPFFAK
jgi:hypothetical protein